jgi:two-component sensor histidine kinase
VIAGAAREAARNAAVHGRGGKSERPLNLTICIAQRDGLTVTVSDDGVGLGNAPALTSEIPAGSGGGLILHSTMLAILGGSLTVENGEPIGVRVVVRLPTN